MNPNIIVRVHSVLCGEKEVGTGYPISQNRILTARHIVFCEKNETEIIEAETINVVWPKLGKERERPSAEAKVIWRAKGKEVDLAVLECKFPEEVRGPFGTISCQLPSPHDKWESAGFAKAEATEDTRPLVSLNGECIQAPANIDFHFDLGVTAPTSLKQGWQGVSGAPVFMSGVIKGVIAKCLEPYENQRLRAIRVDNLHNDEAFCNAIGLQIVDRSKKVAYSISRYPCSIEIIKKLFGLSGSVERDSQSLAQSLLNYPPKEFLSKMAKQCMQWDNDGWPQNITMGDICEFVFQMTPFLIDGAGVEQLKEKINSTQCQDPLPYHTYHMAEAAMAAHDGRTIKAKVADGENGKRQFRADYAVPDPVLPNGFNFDPGDAVKNVVGDLKNRLTYGHDASEPQMLKNIDEILELDFGVRTIYLAYRARNEIEGQKMRETTAELRNLLKNLPVFPLDVTDAASANESTIPRCLDYFLELSAKANK